MSRLREQLTLYRHLMRNAPEEMRSIFEALLMSEGENGRYKYVVMLA